MDFSPVLVLCVHLAGMIAFIAFVFRWSALFSSRIEPALRRRVSQWLGIEIIRRQKGPNYHWVTPDKRPKSQALVFLWGALLFLGLGFGPMGLALLIVGLLLNAING